MNYSIDQVVVIMDTKYWEKLVIEAITNLNQGTSPELEEARKFFSKIYVPESLDKALEQFDDESYNCGFLVIDPCAFVNNKITDIFCKVRQFYSGPILVCSSGTYELEAIKKGADVFIQQYGNRSLMLRALEQGIEKAIIINSRVRRRSYNVQVPVLPEPILPQCGKF